MQDVVGIKDNKDGTWTATIKDKQEDGSYKRRQKTFRSKTAAQDWRERQLGRKEGSEAFRQSGIEETRAGTWKVYVDKKMPDGTRFRRKKSFQTLAEAEAWRDAAHDALDKGMPVPEPKSAAVVLPTTADTPELVGELARVWFAERYEKRLQAQSIVQDTRDSAWRDLNQFVIKELGSVRLTSLRPDQVEAVITQMASNGYVKSRQNRVLWFVREMYEMARARGWDNRQPTYGLKAQRPAKKSTYRVKHKPTDALAANRNADGTIIDFHPISVEQMRQMSAGLDKQMAVVGWASYLLGTRIGEILGLRMCDVDIEARLVLIDGMGGRPYSDFDSDGNPVKVRRTDRVKGGVENNKAKPSRRLLALPEALTGYFTEIAAQRTAAGAADEDPFFTARNGIDGLSSHSISSAFTRVSRELFDDNQHLRPHDLRKNSATNLTMMDVKPFDLSVWLGHEVGPYDGQADVTASTYIKAAKASRSVHLARLKAVAALLDELVGTEPLIPVYAEDTEWVTVQEAAEIVGTNRKAITALIKNGTLAGQQRYLSRNRRAMAWHVRKDDLAKWEQEKGLGMAGMCAKYNLYPEALKAVCQEAGITYRSNRDGIGSGRDFIVFDQDQAEALDELMRTRAEFLATHWDKKTLMEETGLSRHQTDSLIRCGVLTPVTPTFAHSNLGYGSGHAVWFETQAVKAAMPVIRKRMRRGK